MIKLYNEPIEEPGMIYEILDDAALIGTLEY